MRTINFATGSSNICWFYCLQENCTDFEDSITVQCDQLIESINEKKLQLIDFIRQDKETKLKLLKEQVSTCTYKLQHTTGLLQFCIEALKETDSTAFLQVESMLINRVANVDLAWHKDLMASPRVSPEFDLTLDDKPVIRAIQQLNFIQMKRKCPAELFSSSWLTDHSIPFLFAWFSSSFSSFTCLTFTLWTFSQFVNYNGHFEDVSAGCDEIVFREKF